MQVRSTADSAGSGASSLDKRSDGEHSRNLLDTQLVPHGLHLIAKVIGVEHPGASLGLAAGNRGKPFILFGQCDFNFDLFQFDFGHLSDFQPKTTETIGQIAIDWTDCPQRIPDISEFKAMRVGQEREILEWNCQPVNVQLQSPYLLNPAPF